MNLDKARGLLMQLKVMSYRDERGYLRGLTVHDPCVLYAFDRANRAQEIVGYAERIGMPRDNIFYLLQLYTEYVLYCKHTAILRDYAEAEALTSVDLVRCETVIMYHEAIKLFLTKGGQKLKRYAEKIPDAPFVTMFDSGDLIQSVLLYNDVLVAQILKKYEVIEI